MTGHASARPGLRVRLLSAVLTTIAVVLAALTAAFNIVLVHRLAADAQGVASAHATAQLDALRTDHGRIVLGEAPDAGAPDAGVWVYQGRRAIEAPRSAVIPDPILARLAASAPARQDLSSPRVLLDSLPVTVAGRRVGAVIAAISLAPYDQTRRTALVASVLLAVVAFVVVGLACNWLIRHALLPVTRMTRQAAEWGAHDVDRRFAQGPPRDELTQLAFTLDGLLDRLAASLRHEQRLSAELSHELRTPLATIAAEAQHALRHAPMPAEGRGALKQILDVTRHMTETLDTLIAAARAQLRSEQVTSDATTAARAAAGACAAQADARDLEITVNSSERLPVAAERHLVERILAPLLDNACRHATRHIRIEVRRTGSGAAIAVLDDGHGVPAEQLEAIFEPGRRAEAVTASSIAVAGAGLGLALSRRLARTAGGDVRAVPCHEGGRFIVELPSGGG